ncbi:unnamed protein product [Penicillium pancosmium]
MAHQAHNIPWGLLASNLEWKTPTPFNAFATNLYPRMKPNQAKDLTHFVNAFVKTLNEHSVCERKKYPEHYDIPKSSDMILDDAIVRKISPTVRRWRCNWPRNWPRANTCPLSKCKAFEVVGTNPRWRDLRDECTCVVIPQEERVMSAFLRDPRVEIDWRNSGDDSNDEAIFNNNFVLTLLLYGEMEPILRVCAHPGNHLRFWHDGSYFEGPHDLGWEQICRQMLSVYICLNIAYCFPETWDSASGRSEERDYRNARFYQQTLIESCAKNQDLRMYPHIQFFGMQSCERLKENTGKGEHWLLDEGINKHISEGGKKSSFPRWMSSAKYGPAGPYGRVPIREFLSLWRPEGCSYVASSSEIDKVRSMLCSKGLPMELALEIMKFADYKTPKSKLDPPHDPLHPANREALGQYLKYCWKTLVLCYTMATEIGMDPLDRMDQSDRSNKINWKNLVGDAIIDLFDHRKDRRYDWRYEFSRELPPRIWYKKEGVSDDDAPAGWRGPFTTFV